MKEMFNKLISLIKDSSNVILTTHSSMDMDGLASCLVMKKIVESYNKKCFFLVEDKEPLPTTVKVIDTHPEVTFDHYNSFKEEINDQTLLIVLDTHLERLLQLPSIINHVKNIAVIDHHIKSTGYIQNTVLAYINSRLSSTCEIVTNLIEYLDFEIDTFYATLLLTGIELDTNNFYVKTTDKTYQAASHLAKIGIDTIYKKMLLKENIDNYLSRQDFIKRSFMLNDTMAICTLDEELYNKAYLAKISEELLRFDDVEAAFTIGYIKNNLIGVSARSIANVDVQSLMTKMGGGGHYNNAACQIKNKTIDEVRTELFRLIKEEGYNESNIS